MNLTSSYFLQDLSPSLIIDALEENLIEYLLYYSNRSETSVYRTDEYLAILTGIPQPALNMIIRARFPLEMLENSIATAIAPFKKRQVPTLWCIFPSSRPQTLELQLAAHGMRYYGEKPGMALDLLTLPESIALPVGLTIEEVADTLTLHEWIETSALAFGGNPEDLDQDYVSFEQHLKWGQHLPYRRFLGRLNGVVVGTSAIFLGKEVAGLYAVGTLPTAQRQGIGTALSLTALYTARHAGYRVGVLESSLAGYHVYTTLGFREYCRIRSYLGDFTFTTA